MITLPGSGFSAADLRDGDYVRLLQVFRAEEDTNWASGGATPEAQASKLLVSAPLDNITDPNLVVTGRLLEVDTISHGMDGRLTGGLGGTSTASARLWNDVDGSWLDSLAGLTYPWSLEGRHCRIGLIKKNAPSIASAVWLFSGRIMDMPHAEQQEVVLRIEDDRLRTEEKLPREVFRSGLSQFEGFRSANTTYGKPIPLVFGEVPAAEGFTVVVGWENETSLDLQGRLVVFADTTEGWQVVEEIRNLLWGDDRLVSGTYQRGYATINEAAGGAHAARSPYTINLPKGGFYFDDFNQEYLHLKIDVLFSFLDRFRDDRYSVGITGMPNFMDDDPATTVRIPAYSRGVGDFLAYNIYKGVWLPFPDFGGIEFFIDQDASGEWRAYDYGSISANDWGYFAVPHMVADSALGAGCYWTVCWGVFSGSTYETPAGSKGPAWFDTGIIGTAWLPAGPENVSWEFERMGYRNNNTPGAPVGSSNFAELSEFETRQGSGLSIFFGVMLDEGASFPGGDLHGLVVRVWGRMKFPDDGFFATVRGYEDAGYAWTSTPNGDTLESLPGILGLLLSKALNLGEPVAASFLADESTNPDGATDVYGRQIVEQENGTDLIDSLLKNSNRFLLGSDDYWPGLSGGTFRVVNLRALGAAVYTFTSLDITEPATPSRSPLEEVYTEFELRYRYNRMRGEYDGVLIASPTETSTAVDSGLQATLLARRKQYNLPRGRRLKLDAPWIQTEAAAALHIEFEARNRSQRRPSVRLVTTMASLAVQQGDPVAINVGLHSSWQTGKKYVVAGKTMDVVEGSIEWQLWEYSNA